MFIIDDILLAPIKGIVWFAEKVRDTALEELEDTPEKLKKELLEFQMLLDADQLTEKEYFKKEKDILERLNALQKVAHH